MKTAIGLATLLLTGIPVMAEFSAAFQRAEKLFRNRDYQKAAHLFLKLADDAPNEHGKNWALSYAARSMGRQKDVYREALDVAKTIPFEPVMLYTQMQIMESNRNFKELSKRFEDADIAGWPDRINYKGFFLRGRSHAVAGKTEAAIEDFAQCARLAGSDTMKKVDALNRLGQLQRNRGNNDGALRIFYKAVAVCEADERLQGKWLYPKTLLGTARILIDRKKYDEAKDMLAGFKIAPSEAKRSAWDFLFLEAYGDIAAAEGKSGKALAKYRQAVAIDTHDSYIARVNKKIKDIEQE